MEMLGTIIGAHVIYDTNQRHIILCTAMKPIQFTCGYQDKSLPACVDKTESTKSVLLEALGPVEII